MRTWKSSLMRSNGAVAVLEIAPEVPPANNIFIVSQLGMAGEGAAACFGLLSFTMISPAMGDVRMLPIISLYLTDYKLYQKLCLVQISDASAPEATYPRFYRFECRVTYLCKYRRTMTLTQSKI